MDSEIFCAPAVSSRDKMHRPSSPAMTHLEFGVKETGATICASAGERLIAAAIIPANRSDLFMAPIVPSLSKHCKQGATLTAESSRRQKPLSYMRLICDSAIRLFDMTNLAIDAFEPAARSRPRLGAGSISVI